MTKHVLDNRILAKHAAEIRRLGKQTVENLIEIGRHLVEAKAEVKKLGGSWGDWLEHEFNWSDQQARRLIHVFERKSELNKLLNSDFPVSALYALAAPSTPNEARDEIIERAQAGETVLVAEVKRTIERTKGRKPPSSKRKPTTKPQANTKSSKDDAANDTDPSSAGEAERLRVRVEELQAQVRQRDITIEGLRRDIAELQKTSGDPVSVSEFQAAIRKWEDPVETEKNIIRELQKAKATRRAVGKAASADDGLDIPESLRREPAR